MTLPTDQKVGGSSPSERTTQTGLVGNPGGACCRMGPPVVVWDQVPRSVRDAFTPRMPGLRGFGAESVPKTVPCCQPFENP